MRILFTICGRAGSKGIKNKNLKQFCGKYLAHYTVSTIDLYLKRHPEIQYDIVVNSDSHELLNLVSDNGLREVSQIVRDENLAGDSIGKIAVINDCLSRMEERYGLRYDMVIDLDITSPLRTVEDLEKVIETQTQVKKTEHGYKQVIESNFTARQQAPKIFDMNASIYAYRPKFLATGKGVLEGYCEVVEMYDTGILDLDHENDFELMEVLAGYLFKTRDEFREVYQQIPNEVLVDA